MRNFTQPSRNNLHQQEYIDNSYSVHLCTLTIILVCSQALAMQTVVRKLSTDKDMPIIGFGTWQIAPKDIDLAVTTALENGYKHIDTAFVYGNEEAIGKTLKKWFDKGNKREDLFITTKLPPAGSRAADVEPCLKLSLERLGLQYVDMYLIHTPFTTMKAGDNFEPAKDADGNMIWDYSTDHLATWKAMEDQVKAGRAKAIGLSNFNETQLLKVINNAEIKPSNLQIELQAYNQQKPLREICAKNNIVVTGYSTLGSPGSESFRQGDNKNKTLPKLLENPVITEIAKHHKKSPAQILLRHSVQNDIVVIPKSITPKRIKENIDIFDFELTKEEMEQINHLDKGEEGRLFNFLNFKGLEKHPEYPFVKQLE